MIYLTIRFIKYLYYCSIFFWYESRNYIGRWTVETVLYYPVAYFHFMSLMVKEYEDFISHEPSFPNQPVINGEEENE